MVKKKNRRWKSFLRLLYMMKSLERDWELRTLSPWRGCLSANAGLVSDYLLPATLLRLRLFVADLLFVSERSFFSLRLRYFRCLLPLLEGKMRRKNYVPLTVVIKKRKERKGKSVWYTRDIPWHQTRLLPGTMVPQLGINIPSYDPHISFCPDLEYGPVKDFAVIVFSPRILPLLLSPTHPFDLQHWENGSRKEFKQRELVSKKGLVSGLPLWSPPLTDQRNRLTLTLAVSSMIQTFPLQITGFQSQ